MYWASVLTNVLDLDLIPGIRTRAASGELGCDPYFFYSSMLFPPRPDVNEGMSSLTTEPS